MLERGKSADMEFSFSYLVGIPHILSWRNKRCRPENKMKILSIILVGFLFAGCAFAGCTLTEDEKKGGGRQESDITVVTREEGSGTRRAFVELTGIQKGKQDKTTENAEVTNSNFVVMMSVAGDKNAIGYVSLGALGNLDKIGNSDKKESTMKTAKEVKQIKAVKIDGVEASIEQIKEGNYRLVRNFYVVVGDDLSKTGQDFIDYVLSDEGQEIIEQHGYIGERTGNTYKAAGLKGKVTMAGSTSAAPVLESLAEQYREYNPNVIFEIQQTGSTAGIETVTQGICDIGITSRELNGSERVRGLTEIRIAMDGIAVIVNRENKWNDMTMEDIRKIYMGDITNWEGNL